MGNRYCCVGIGVLTVLCALFIACPAFGGDTEGPHVQSIQFAIGQNLNLKEFGGATVSYQRTLSDRVAWRLGVTVESSILVSEVSAVGTGSAEVDASDDETNWHHKLSVTSEWLFRRGKSVSVYYGAGPRLSYETSQRERVMFGTGSAQGWIRTDRSRWSAITMGVVGVLGVQWAPCDWFALHAEYRVNAGYVRQVDERWVSETTDTEYDYAEEVISNGFTLDSEGARTGISVFF